jgi:S-DNA-T family DNA segregation ATPase FtsK/SpoIIIE
VNSARRSTRSGSGPFARVGEHFADFVLGRGVDDETAARLGEIKGLLFGGCSLFLLVALATFQAPLADSGGGANVAGQVGYYLARLVLMAIGWSGYCMVFLGLTWGVVLIARKKVELASLRFAGGVLFLFSSALLLQLGFGAQVGATARLPWGPGGYLALELVGPDPDPVDPYAVPFLIAKFGRSGLWIVLTLASLVSFMLATQWAFYPALARLSDWLDERREARGESLGQALWGWSSRTASALWSFLRGADLEGAAEDAAVVELRPAPRPEAAEPTARRAQGGRRSSAAGDAEADESDLEPDAPGEPDENGENGDEPEDADEPGGGAERELVAVAAASEASPAERAKARKGKAKKEKELAAMEPVTPPAGPWKFPPLELLEPPVARGSDDERSIEAQAKKLEQALASFHLEAQVVGAKVGPTVTMFELEVVQGTRLNKVTQLSSEIAAALRAKSVRVIAPIPGKSTIGIEVPNAAGRRTVRISELVNQRAYDTKHGALPMFLGVDTEGQPIVEDLARMPHLLIAGTTGSGKSVCINTVLASILLTRSPHDVKLILVDPKMVEMMIYAKVPHLMLPVVTDTKHATSVLLWLVEKMEGRYDLFQKAGVKNIKGYNALAEPELRQRLGEHWNETHTPRHVPYIVLVIDELADLVMTARKEAEHAITRLAQKSRAVGIHVIVATQRPSTDVITGVIKGNLPTRIAFQVASKIDSRVILDSSGAEKLLGQGDMLYNPPQSSQIRRVQGALVEDHELQALVDFACREAAPSFSQELVQVATGTAQSAQSEALDPDADPLFDEAVRYVLKTKRGSASLLQRALGVGYTRASRLIDIMAQEGILGEFKGSKAREVLMTLEDWETTHGPSQNGGPTAADGGDE